MEEDEEEDTSRICSITRHILWQISCVCVCVCVCVCILPLSATDTGGISEFGAGMRLRKLMGADGAGRIAITANAIASSFCVCVCVRICE